VPSGDELMQAIVIMRLMAFLSHFERMGAGSEARAYAILADANAAV
jgi:hypothetical protein